MTGELDAAAVPWIEWAYNGMIGDHMQPAGLDNLRNRDVFTALVRPSPQPSPARPRPSRSTPPPRSSTSPTPPPAPAADGRARGALTDVVVPALRYPNGYTATAQGASVVSKPCAPTLQLRNQPNASTVSVHVTPGGPCR